MTELHRTQILLEPWQYEALRSRAHAERISLSELIRRIVEHAIQGDTPTRGRLKAIQGIGEDDEATGRDHDRVLCGA